MKKLSLRIILPIVLIITMSHLTSHKLKITASALTSSDSVPSSSSSKASSERYRLTEKEAEEFYRIVPDPFNVSRERGGNEPNFKIQSKKKANSDLKIEPLFVYDAAEVREKAEKYLEDKYGKDVKLSDFRELYQDADFESGKTIRVYSAFTFTTEDEDGKYTVAIDGGMNYIGDSKETTENEAILKSVADRELGKTGLNFKASYTFAVNNLPFGYFSVKADKSNEDKIIESLTDLRARIIASDNGKLEGTELKNIFSSYPFSREIEAISLTSLPSEGINNDEFTQFMADNYERLKYYSFLRANYFGSEPIEFKGNVSVKKYGDYTLVFLPPYEERNLIPEITIDRPDSLRKSIEGMLPLGEALRLKNKSGNSLGKILVIFPSEKADSVLSEGEKVGYFTHYSNFPKSWNQKNSPQEFMKSYSGYYIYLNVGEEMHIQPVIYPKSLNN